MKLFVARLGSHSLCVCTCCGQTRSCLSLGENEDREKDVSFERKILRCRYRIDRGCVLDRMGSSAPLGKSTTGDAEMVFSLFFLVGIRCVSIACSMKMSRMWIWMESLEEEFLAVEGEAARERERRGVLQVVAFDWDSVGLDLPSQLSRESVSVVGVWRLVRDENRFTWCRPSAAASRWSRRRTDATPRAPARGFWLLPAGARSAQCRYCTAY